MALHPPHEQGRGNGEGTMRQAPISSEMAAVMRTQGSIDRSIAGTPERQTAVEQMKALQRVFAKRNAADRADEIRIERDAADMQEGDAQ